MKKIISIFVILIMLLSITNCKDKEEKYKITFLTENNEVYKELEVTSEQEVIIEDLTKEGHTFDGWYLNDQKILLPTKFNENTTLTPRFTINRYTYKFLVDGKVLSEGTINYGSTIPYPNNPTKEGTKEIKYVFSKWDKEDTIIKNNIEFNAIFEETKNTYTYKFLVDGKTIKEETVEYGSTINYPANPTKEATKEYTYEFIGWDKKDTILKDNITFNAIFESIKNKYTYKFIDEDGTLLKEETVEYGTLPIEPDHPSKDGFKFTGWDKEISKVTDNIEYQATYEEIEVVSSLDNKVVSILGDSISTFYVEGSEMNSYYHGENQFYYPTYSSTIKTVDLTWWYKLIKNNNMKLGINNSWSGSCAYGTSSSAGMTDGRINTITENGDPDIVIIYLGTNDCAGGFEVANFATALRTMINKIEKITDADIFVTTLGYTNYTGNKYKEENRISYNEEIRKIAKELECGIVPLDEYITETSYSFYLGDFLHYNAKGAELLSLIYEKSIKEYYGINFDKEIKVEHKEQLPEGVLGKVTATCNTDFWGNFANNVFLVDSSFTSPQFSYRIILTKNENNQYVVTNILKSGDTSKLSGDYIIIISDSHNDQKTILADLENVGIGAIAKMDPTTDFPIEITFKEGDGTVVPPVEEEPKEDIPTEENNQLVVGAYNEGVWTKHETTVIAYSYEAMDKTSTFIYFYIIGIQKDNDNYKVVYLKNVGDACDFTVCDYYILIYSALSVKTYYENASINQEVVMTGDVTTGKCSLLFK